METIKDLTSSKYPEVLNSFIKDMKINGNSEDTQKAYSMWVYNFIQNMKSLKYHSAKNVEVKDIDISQVKNSLFGKITKIEVLLSVS